MKKEIRTAAELGFSCFALLFPVVIWAEENGTIREESAYIYPEAYYYYPYPAQGNAASYQERNHASYDGYNQPIVGATRTSPGPMDKDQEIHYFYGEF